jgi:metal-dependent amidase/aminoacylase/carboxypeptidase family protein
MKSNLTSRLRRLAADLAPQLSDWRRQIHMQPEASMQEHDTAAFVVARLQELGAEDIRTGVGRPA